MLEHLAQAIDARDAAFADATAAEPMLDSDNPAVAHFSKLVLRAFADADEACERAFVAAKQPNPDAAEVAALTRAVVYAAAYASTTAVVAAQIENGEVDADPLETLDNAVSGRG